MPGLGRLQQGARQLFRRWPAAEAFAFLVLDGWYRISLWPFRRPRRRGRAIEDATRVDRTDTYNAAAERYFADALHAQPFLLNKPFSEPLALPKHLIDAGVLIRALRVGPGDTVLEVGAGSCWLSHMLNRYGCTTVAVDVSATALEIGQQLFRSDPRTNWDRQPRFVAYDGHRLPVEDASCDGVVINDAFHHIPNQRALLEELHRVLRPEGVVAMSEPGRGHGDTEHSLREARDWGVLENELVVEDVAALARAVGFSRATVVAASPFVDMEVHVEDLGAFMGGKGFSAYWKTFCGALERHHYLVLAKGDGTLTTRRPGTLVARIAVSGSEETHAVGEAPRWTLSIVNAGDTTWLGGDVARSGWTRVGAHLYRSGAEPELVEYDWWRGVLPARVAPGTSVTLDAVLPPLPAAGRYLVVVDLVVEGVTWFSDAGSPPVGREIHVT